VAGSDSFRRQQSGFLIIGLLYYAQDYQDFLYLRNSYYSATTSAAVLFLLLSHDFSSSIILITQPRLQQYYPDLRALPIVLHILISINSTDVPLYSIYPLRKLRGRNFFVRWVDCNTPFPEYVLSCVFRFSDRIFRFTFCIYSVL